MKQEQTYRVTGMTCGGCAKSVKQVIEALGDGAQATADFESNTVVVSGVDDVNAIKDAVENAGFDFEGAV